MPARDSREHKTTVPLRSDLGIFSMSPSGATWLDHYPAARRRARIHKSLYAAYGVLTAETSRSFQVCKVQGSRHFVRASFKFRRRNEDLGTFVAYTPARLSPRRGGC